MAKLAGKVLRIQFQNVNGEWVDITGDIETVTGSNNNFAFEVIDMKTWRRRMHQRKAARRFVEHRLGRN